MQSIRSQAFTPIFHFWNTAIITADGYYLDDYEYGTHADYAEHALGNIKDDSFRELLDKVKQVSPGRFIEKIECITTQSKAQPPQ